MVLSRNCADATSIEYMLPHPPLMSVTVSRVGVSAAASALQAQGLVRYARGDVTIIDGKGLEAASCACYRSDLAIHRQGMSARPVARH